MGDLPRRWNTGIDQQSIDLQRREPGLYKGLKRRRDPVVYAASRRQLNALLWRVGTALPAVLRQESSTQDVVSVGSWLGHNCQHPTYCQASVSISRQIRIRLVAWRCIAAFMRFKGPATDIPNTSLPKRTVFAMAMTSETFSPSVTA
jgi:hypothetical protein